MRKAGWFSLLYLQGTGRYSKGKIIPRWKTRVGTICIDLDGPSSQHLWVPSTFATAKLWSGFKSFKNKLRKIEKLHPGKGKQLKRVPFFPFIFHPPPLLGSMRIFPGRFGGSKHFPIQLSTPEALHWQSLERSKLARLRGVESDWRPPTLTSFDLTKSYHYPPTPR